jgi:hypothetical protein
MDAQEVLNDMVRRYAAYNSYSDTGQVMLTHPNFVTKTTFSTYYKAPSLFRFDFARPHPHPPLNYIVTQHVAGFDGTSAYQTMKPYKGNVETRGVENVGLAIAGAAGISTGAAHTIGRLLLADTEGLSIPDLVDAQVHEDTAIDQIACYSIAARHPNFPGKYELQIEKNTLLLRGFLSEHETSRFEESRMNIRINEPIEDALFIATLRDQSA